MGYRNHIRWAYNSSIFILPASPPTKSASASASSDRPIGRPGQLPAGCGQIESALTGPSFAAIYSIDGFISHAHPPIHPFNLFPDLIWLPLFLCATSSRAHWLFCPLDPSRNVVCVIRPAFPTIRPRSAQSVQPSIMKKITICFSYFYWVINTLYVNYWSINTLT